MPDADRQADWTTMSPFTPTLRLHDRYVLRERIGLGGMSEVWRADDEVLHRPVAVKALAAELAADPHLRATIQREARAAARLTHPHVTQVYDYGEAALGGPTVVPYLVMELVEGHSLADRLASGPLPWPEAVRLAGQVAAALAAAHRIGVVHRDIKPANIMLTESGAKVLDFGIAALAGPHQPRTGADGDPRPGRSGSAPGAHQSRPGPDDEPMMGTPAYLAPERFRPGPPNPASDVYALGALLHRALAGRAPLPVQTWADALEAHAQRRQPPPLRVPGLPPDVAALTLACLSADPARRPTAAQLARRLGATPAGTRPAAASAPARPADPTPPDHPPTLVDRAGSWAAPARPGRASGPASPPARVPGPVPAAEPARRAPRGPGQGNRLPGVLVAAGMALLVGVVALLALGDGAPTPPTGAPTTVASAAGKPTEPPRSAAAPPTTARSLPVTLRQLAAEFTALIDEAQARGDIDRETADDLREEVAELNRGKLKDRAKHLRDLREDIAEAVERDEIGGETAARLRELLTGFPGARGDAAG
ncbi:serine/threonine protein kinase [Micromonospora sp. WMMD712]|uniref:serine/threonine-protein kinase n=1 Tax=Micromonospora sp. WMMD712 TaxID=3016096 RepID=UPI002499DE17|nr:serine/threonine protein kinase [Micromonospora sp. WMMD712]WFE56314.1 protein kinase [Micromonospora sp. WMMD712]